MRKMKSIVFEIEVHTCIIRETMDRTATQESGENVEAPHFFSNVRNETACKKLNSSSNRILFAAPKVHVKKKK